MSERVNCEIVDGIADVRLNRPDKMNALDPSMFEGIVDVLKRLEEEPGLRAAVLSGEGKAFCAGLDMMSFTGMAQNGAPFDITARTLEKCNLFQHVAYGWRQLAVPVITAIHGVAFGGGLQIASGGDIRIVAPDARLSIMEIKWGIVPDMGGTVLWRDLVRGDVLRELAFTGRIFSGEEALTFGFATRVSADPRADAMALAKEIAGSNPGAIRAAKRLFNMTADWDEAALLLAESEEQAKLIGSPNQIEAVMANMEKRPPRFASPQS
jgi:enoyl-CoA hydratase/carnithine racemase